MPPEKKPNNVRSRGARINGYAQLGTGQSQDRSYFRRIKSEKARGKFERGIPISLGRGRLDGNLRMRKERAVDARASRDCGVNYPRTILVAVRAVATIPAAIPIPVVAKINRAGIVTPRIVAPV